MRRRRPLHDRNLAQRRRTENGTQRQGRILSERKPGPLFASNNAITFPFVPRPGIYQRPYSARGESTATLQLLRHKRHTESVVENRR